MQAAIFELIAIPQSIIQLIVLQYIYNSATAKIISCIGLCYPREIKIVIIIIIITIIIIIIIRNS